MKVTTGHRDPAAVHRLLRALPAWFGIESAIDSYVEDARALPTYLATTEDGTDPVVGVLLVARHFPTAAEIHLMAVAPDHHRRGVGRALVEALEADLRADGVEFLQVKTLGAAHPSPEYARTRKFYLALGFRPLEELPDLWPGNPCLLMIKSLDTPRG